MPNFSGNYRVNNFKRCATIYLIVNSSYGFFNEGYGGKN